MVDLNDSQIKIEPTIDGNEICTIWVDDDEIYQRVTDKRAQDLGKEELKKLLHNITEDDSHMFLSIKVEDKLIGLMSVHPYEEGYEIHPAILKQYRKEYAAKAVKKAINWVFTNKECTILYAEIPVLYKTVYDFAIRQGFKLDHIKEDAHLHYDDRYYDVWVISLEENKCQA